MHLSLVLFAAPLALASTHLNVLQARQGSDAFIPGVGNLVSDCPAQNLCGADTCLRRERGDVCCVENYGCPGGSFCLTQGYCCPDGDDPATCATQFGITLPNGFVAGQTLGAASAATPVATSPAIATQPPASTTAVIVAPTLSSAPPVYYPIPSNATVSTLPSPSASAGGSGTETFTGGAATMRYSLGAGGIMGAVGILAAMVL